MVYNAEIFHMKLSYKWENKKMGGLPNALTNELLKLSISQKKESFVFQACIACINFFFFQNSPLIIYNL